MARGRTALLIAWWVAFFPGVMIFITAMGFNMLGDGLRDIMDPKTTVESVETDDVELEARLDDLPDRITVRAKTGTLTGPGRSPDTCSPTASRW